MRTMRLPKKGLRPAVGEVRVGMPPKSAARAGCSGRRLKPQPFGGQRITYPVVRMAATQVHAEEKAMPAEVTGKVKSGSGKSHDVKLDHSPR